MKYVYFTKTLERLSIKELIAFCKAADLDGVDMAIRPGYPVTPDNAARELPIAVRAFRDAGLIIGLASAPTNLNDPNAAAAGKIFEACAKTGVPAVKIGYFPYRSPYDTAVKEARTKLTAWAKVAASHKVKVLLHTHSGAMLGNNAAGARVLLEGLDAHHVGAYFDTGHTAVNGGPPRMELDILRTWLSAVAIKDMVWAKTKGGWAFHVAPVGDGIVRWADVAAGLRERRFNGTVSLHGEYEAKDRAERETLAKREVAALRKLFTEEGKKS
jgi:sugar phosphate isomerase/epimerase